MRKKEDISNFLRQGIKSSFLQPILQEVMSQQQLSCHVLFISPTSDLNSVPCHRHPVPPCHRSQCLSLNRENEDNIIRRPNAAIMRHVMSSHHNPVMCWDSKVLWHCMALCIVQRCFQACHIPFFARPKSRISGVVISGGISGKPLRHVRVQAEDKLLNLIWAIILNQILSLPGSRSMF